MACQQNGHRTSALQYICQRCSNTTVTYTDVALYNVLCYLTADFLLKVITGEENAKDGFTFSIAEMDLCSFFGVLLHHDMRDVSYDLIHTYCLWCLHSSRVVAPPGPKRRVFF
jgi:ribosomal protein S27E